MLKAGRYRSIADAEKIGSSFVNRLLRLTLLAPDILRNEIMVEDEYLERPWSYSYTYRRMPGYKLLEYVCEDNRDYVDEQGNVTLRITE